MQSLVPGLVARNVLRSGMATRAGLGPNIQVARVLPGNVIDAIGPFVFFDHVGPMPCPDQTIAPHPHAGIEVITYLLEGSNTHQDSKGNTGRVTSGGLQVIQAGSGILHKERIVPETPNFHAVQLWTRLPKELEDMTPTYRTIDANSVPQRITDDSKVRLLAGRLPGFFGEEGPLLLANPSFLAHVELFAEGKNTLHIDPEHELGVYVLDGAVDLSGTVLAAKEICMLGKGDVLRLCNAGSDAAHVLVLGGAPAVRPIMFFGSFVYDSQEGGRRAAERYASGAMGAIDGVPW